MQPRQRRPSAVDSEAAATIENDVVPGSEGAAADMSEDAGANTNEMMLSEPK